MGRRAIFGTGGMGRELADIALRNCASSQLVFVVDRPGNAVQGIEVIDPAELPDDDRLCLAIGTKDVPQEATVYGNPARTMP